jgi:hypothetical protein
MQSASTYLSFVKLASSGCKASHRPDKQLKGVMVDAEWKCTRDAKTEPLVVDHTSVPFQMFQYHPLLDCSSSEFAPHSNEGCFPYFRKQKPVRLGVGFIGNDTIP